MFSEFVETQAGEAGRRGWAIIFSTVVQAVGLLVLLLIPMLYTQALPMLLNLRASVAAPVPLVEAPKPPKTLSQNVRPITHSIFEGGLHEPTSFPARPLVFDGPESAPDVPVSGADFNFNDLLDHLTNARSEAPPPPVVLPSTPPAGRVHETDIQPAMILAQPQPVYPTFARDTRIQGDVVLHAIIDREGRVAELQVVSGHPLLVKAALAAVSAWRYRPTLLNGQAVEVETTIRVSFVLGR